MLLSAIFLYLSPILLIFDGIWLGPLSIVFLLLVYLPASYEVAIEEKSVYSAILLLCKMFLAMLVITLFSELVFTTIGVLLPGFFPDRCFIIAHSQILKFDHFFFLIWRLASVNALFLIIFEVIGIKGKKDKLAKKEDTSPDQEE